MDFNYKLIKSKIMRKLTTTLISEIFLRKFNINYVNIVSVLAIDF